MKGIIMSGDHPKLILDGSKTQTRRVIKPQPNPCRHKEIFNEAESGYNAPPDWQGQLIDWVGYKYEGREGWFCHVCGNGLKHIDEFSAHGILCPYGQVGDRLWVRETWARIVLNPKKIYYKADDPKLAIFWRPSIHMPRWASRITLEIAEVRVERLQEISGVDCVAEGFIVYPDMHPGEAERQEFAACWDSLNAKRGFGWDSDPWVFAISFKKLP